jgi:hypothetical protein
MKKLVGLIGVFSLFGVFGVLPVSADYNPPPAVSDNCDAGHGAFGAFSHHFASNGGINWISQDAKEDGGMGHETGPTESGFSQFCKTQ